jgi:hypothetical protein
MVSMGDPAGRQCLAESRTFSVGAGQAVIDVDPLRLDTEAEQEVALSR